MKNKLPKFKTDAEAEAFVDEADLSQYDLSGMKPVSFEFQPKAKSITMRLPETLFDATKEEVERSGYPINDLSVRPLKTPCILGSKRL
jgi:predicted DNA binding CopG/RHH family protein